jgi:chaperone BCS1
VLTVRYESWEATSWQPRRPLESLVLADNTLEDLVEDLDVFYGSRAWYVRRGIPYRRGYLLYGPPGNGKTTLVLAAAGELNLSVAVLSLSNRSLSDDALRSLVDVLPPATLLLIEDVDCVFKTERATTEQTGVTLSGLLNALDGVSSREGRVLFLTTNHPERLDPALIRPGRVDRKIELGNASPDQARRLFLWFYQDFEPAAEKLASLADRFAAQVPRNKICMAAIQEHLLRHRDAPEAAAHEVVFDEVVPGERTTGEDSEARATIAPDRHASF